MFKFLLLLLPLFLIAEEKVIDLQKLGKIVYHFEDGLCEKIVRLTPLGEIRYEHLYHYDNEGKIISETLIGGLGKIEYSGNGEDGYLIALTALGEEKWSREDTYTFE